MYARLMCRFESTSDYFVRFGKGLGKEEAALGRVWIEVFGRYDAAVLRLVVDVLGESETPERKLSSALSEMRTIESASRASEAIQKGECVKSPATKYNNLLSPPST